MALVGPGQSKKRRRNNCLRFFGPLKTLLKKLKTKPVEKCIVYTKKIAVFFTILELIMSSNFQLKSEKQSSEKLIPKLAFLKANFLFC